METYSLNPKYIAYRDMIGLKVYVKPKNQKNQHFLNAGIVIDETYNTIITTREENPKNYKNNTKQYIKKNCIFRFELENELETILIEIDGVKILKRPENRIKLLKKKNRRWF